MPTDLNSVPGWLHLQRGSRGQGKGGSHNVCVQGAAVRQLLCKYRQRGQQRSPAHRALPGRQGPATGNMLHACAPSEAAASLGAAACRILEPHRREAVLAALALPPALGDLQAAAD